MLNQCVDAWQASGLWADISSRKPIFLEPRGKDQFTSTMEEFYQAIRDSKGACFMAVCRGKVSEGLDFADRNGRAVIITGLPYPPLKDPKVILKRRYLESNRTKENQLLSGQEWYNLDATRAVNQAIGRVIRHRNDYGAILLCDSRFQEASQVQQLSKWVRGHLGAKPASSPFGVIVRELTKFFKNAEETMIQPDERVVDTVLKTIGKEEQLTLAPISQIKREPNTLGGSSKFQKASELATKAEMANSIKTWTPADYVNAAGRSSEGQPAPNAMDFMSRLNSNVKSIDFNCTDNSSGLVTIHKRERSSPTAGSSSANQGSNKRYKLVSNDAIKLEPISQEVPRNNSQPSTSVRGQLKEAPESRGDFLREVRSVINSDQFRLFGKALLDYKTGGSDAFEKLMALLLEVLGTPELRYMLNGMRRYLKTEDKAKFDVRLASLN